ncbi:MAG: hypothetical protein QNJ47_18130 [Nostocaceae cyanobacterium]|nr:hypothetical protein [Nostocaceae cyanobacterium]
MPEENEALLIEEITKLKPTHFADLIRAAQLIYDPARGISGIIRNVDWEGEFGIPRDVTQNLQALGEEFRYASPHIAPEIIWSKLTPETRLWFIENKDVLWEFEEIFPAMDED